MKALEVARVALKRVYPSHHKRNTPDFSDKPDQTSNQNLCLSLSHILDDDSLHLIILQVYDQGDLGRFSQVSRRIRHLSEPVLFRRCKVLCDRRENFLPSNIWTYVCVLIYEGIDGGTYHDLEDAGNVHELLHMPHLHTVVFRSIAYSVPWTAIKACLRAPALSTLEIRHSHWCRPYTFPVDDVAVTHVPLKKFVYRIYEWREMYGRSTVHLPPVDEMVASETLCLGPLILQMNDTIEHLRVPSEPLMTQTYGL
ncbi:hypothetical protein OF83DRAFT_690110 [Amylostereum chailletii]|nr:hypothetical protein OF83DRAFT_690110 [Amylostereum chailletii]